MSKTFSLDAIFIVTLGGGLFHYPIYVPMFMLLINVTGNF